MLVGIATDIRDEKKKPSITKSLRPSVFIQISAYKQWVQNTLASLGEERVQFSRFGTSGSSCIVIKWMFTILIELFLWKIIAT